MDLTIAALLTQDGVTNGAIYALLALASWYSPSLASSGSPRASSLRTGR